MRLWMLAVCLTATSATADVLVPNRTLRPGEVISRPDLVLKPGEVSGAIEAPDAAVGQEARIALYPGRPIFPEDIGPPAIIERNQKVTLIYHAHGLRIVAEGRALGRGAQGDIVRVMNSSSRSTVSGRVTADGTVRVN